MKSKQSNNPLKSLENQMDNILFNHKSNNIEIEKKVYKKEKMIISSFADFKKQLICLVKELKSKNLHLVA